MKLYIKDFFSKCDQIRWKLRIWSHLLKKFLMENFSFCELTPLQYKLRQTTLLLLSQYYSHINYINSIAVLRNIAEHQLSDYFKLRSKPV